MDNQMKARLDYVYLVQKPEKASTFCAYSPSISTLNPKLLNPKTLNPVSLKWALRSFGCPTQASRLQGIHTCNPNNLQFYGLYLQTKGYLLLNCRLLEPQVDPKPFILNPTRTSASKL